MKTMTALRANRFMGFFGWSYFYGAGPISHTHLSLASLCLL